MSQSAWRLRRSAKLSVKVVNRMSASGSTLTETTLPGGGGSAAAPLNKPGTLPVTFGAIRTNRVGGRNHDDATIVKGSILGQGRSLRNRGIRAASWRITHDSTRWPIHGHYDCKVCGMSHSVRVSRGSLDETRAAVESRVAAQRDVPAESSEHAFVDREFPRPDPHTLRHLKSQAGSRRGLRLDNIR
jgi:hypothetical protein